MLKVHLCVILFSLPVDLYVLVVAILKMWEKILNSAAAIILGNQETRQCYIPFLNVFTSVI